MRTKTKAVALGLGIAVLASGAALGVRARAGETAADRAHAATLGEVERRGLSLTAEASGLVEPIQVVEVKFRPRDEGAPRAVERRQQDADQQGH